MNRITEEQFEKLFWKAITTMEDFRKFLPNNTWAGIDYKCEYDSDGNPDHRAQIQVSPCSGCEIFRISIHHGMDENMKELERLRLYLDEMTRNRRKVVEAEETIYGTGSEGFTHDEIG